MLNSIEKNNLAEIIPRDGNQNFVNLRNVVVNLITNSKSIQQELK